MFSGTTIPIPTSGTCKLQMGTAGRIYCPGPERLLSINFLLAKHIHHYKSKDRTLTEKNLHIKFFKFITPIKNSWECSTIPPCLVCQFLDQRLSQQVGHQSPVSTAECTLSLYLSPTYQMLTGHKHIL